MFNILLLRINDTINSNAEESTYEIGTGLFGGDRKKGRP